MADKVEQSVFDRYETIGVIVPGASLVLGIWFLFPTAFHGLRLKDVTLGTFGVFAVAAFCVGHIVQAPANALMDLLWHWLGRPTERMRKKGCGLSDGQVELIPERVSTVLGIRVPDDATEDQWRAVTAQIATAITTWGNSARLDKFNANYGLFRGVTASLVLLAVTGIAVKEWWAALVFGLAGVATGYRMKRFSAYYARELWMQFLSRSGENLEDRRQ